MRHFYFNSGPITDEPAAILEQLEKCFAELGKHKGQFAYIRQPPQIVREKCFDTGRKMAKVFCRICLTDSAHDLFEDSAAKHSEICLTQGL